MGCAKRNFSLSRCLTYRTLGINGLSSESQESSGSCSDVDFEPSAKLCMFEHGQNRQSYYELARCCDRYNISDRAGAALATSVLIDHGLVSERDQTLAVDRSKLRREREKKRFEVPAEEERFFEMVDVIYVDGKKDATLKISNANGHCTNASNLKNNLQ